MPSSQYGTTSQVRQLTAFLVGRFRKHHGAKLADELNQKLQNALERRISGLPRHAKTEEA